MNARLSRLAVLSLLSVVCIWPLSAMFGHVFDDPLHPCQWGNSGAAGDILVFFILTGATMSVAAVVLGLLAASGIKRSHGRLGGLWLARVGMVLGAFSLIAFMGIPEMMDKGERGWVVKTLRTLHEAESTYLAHYGHVGYSPDLISLGPPVGNDLPSADSAGLVDAELAKGLYCEGQDPLIYTPRADAEGAIVGYSLQVWSRGVITAIDETGEIRVVSGTPPANASIE